MPDSLRYFTGPDGQLLAVVEPGRCSRYWQLWSCESQAAARLATRPDNAALIAQLIKDRQEAAEQKAAHLEVCKICRAWMETCEHYADAAAALNYKESEVMA